MYKKAIKLTEDNYRQLELRLGEDEDAFEVYIGMYIVADFGVNEDTKMVSFVNQAAFDKMFNYERDLENGWVEVSAK